MKRQIVCLNLLILLPFLKLHTQTKNKQLQVLKEQFGNKKDNTLVFTIEADRFLRNMVRAIVGTLLEVGLGRKSVEDFVKIIQSKDRAKAGASFLHALYLTQVTYPKSIWL